MGRGNSKLWKQKTHVASPLSFSLSEGNINLSEYFTSHVGSHKCGLCDHVSQNKRLIRHAQPSQHFYSEDLSIFKSVLAPCFSMSPIYYLSFGRWLDSKKCCGPGCLSRIRIFPSRVLGRKDSGSTSKNLNSVFLTEKNVSNHSEIWSGMLIPDPDLDFLWYPSRMPDPGVKMALDPGSKVFSKFDSRYIF